MNRKTLNLLLAVVCVLTVFVLAFVTYPVANAQTTDKSRVTPTPQQTTPKPAQTTPKTSPTTSPSVTPEPDETITIETELVNLNVRVVDRNNHSINNLKKDEFKVFENNVPQEIESFSKAEVPTNYGLVIDNSGSLRHQLEKVIEASKIIVNTNRPEDETCVVRFVNSEKIEIVQDFTSKKADINEALDNLYIEGGQTAIIDAVYLAAEKVDEYEKSRNPNEKKRRALIIVSDGEDRDSYYKEQQLFELLRESDVQIYAIGFVNELTKEGGFIAKSPQEKAKSLLTRMATETGGKVYFPNSVSELNQIAADISSELRTQYVLSYYPTEEAKDGSFKNIKVQVADGPNKEKRIAITKSGRKAGVDSSGNKPTLQNQTKPTP
ncbi:MAG: VWA domain-containing protein [Pyrinomonadaceae bacterium]|nr:VWA domain-containing protein [Pyrinomonadaceae bacterium]